MPDLEEKCDGGLVFKIIEENNSSRFCIQPKSYKCDSRGIVEKECEDGEWRYLCRSVKYNHPKD